jgi:hypothetical protein
VIVASSVWRNLLIFAHNLVGARHRPAVADACLPHDPAGARRHRGDGRRGLYGDPTVHPQTEDYWGNVNPIGFRSWGMSRGLLKMGGRRCLP